MWKTQKQRQSKETSCYLPIWSRTTPTRSCRWVSGQQFGTTTSLKKLILRMTTKNIQPLPSRALASTACKAATIQRRRYSTPEPGSLALFPCRDGWSCTAKSVPGIKWSIGVRKWLGIGETRAMTEFGRREGRWLRSSFNFVTICIVCSSNGGSPSKIARAMKLAVPVHRKFNPMLTFPLLAIDSVNLCQK